MRHGLTKSNPILTFVFLADHLLPVSSNFA
jgi:hypothetical protein